MENKKYHTVGTVPKYHTVGTVPKYHTVGTVLKFNRKIVETETKWIPLRHMYMTGHFPDLIQNNSIKSGWVKLVLWPKPPLIVK
jgi:hypothetical protein